MERSIFSGRYCFVQTLHCSGVMQPAEHYVIIKWFKWITNNVNVDLIGKMLNDNLDVHNCRRFLRFGDLIDY